MIVSGLCRLPGSQKSGIGLASKVAPLYANENCKSLTHQPMERPKMLIKETENPINLFAEWLEEAGKTEPEYPDAMTLATCTKEGRPSARMVLLKGFDDRGFTFYTNLGSAKAGQLDENPMAALCFHWKSLHRQIRIEGRVEKVGDDEADAYFASRPRLSQIGAWASKQSQPLEGRWVFEKRIAEFTAKFNLGTYRALNSGLVFEWCLTI